MKINIKVDFFAPKIWWFQKKVVPLHREEDPYLNKCVETLQKIDFEIRQRENRKEIIVKGTHLHGTLTFYIND